MVGGVITNDVHHRYACTLRVVQISQTVGETRPTMEQRCRRLSSDPRITVRCPGRDALEEGKHTAYSRDPVERSDEMHFARTGIGKTGIDSTASQRMHQAFSATHAFLNHCPISR